ncbi:release factor [Trametes gibbosa]|nr:release factor [Trametes gibbosa]
MFSVLQRAATVALIRPCKPTAFLPTGSPVSCLQGQSRWYTLSSVPDHGRKLALCDAISNVERTMEDIESCLNADKIALQVQQTEAALEDPQLWTVNPAAALAAQKRLSDMQHKLSTRKQFRSTFDRLKELTAMAEKVEDADLQTAVLLQLQGLQQSAQQQITSILLSDPTDQNSTYITIRAGSGDTEARGWASMLAHMYTKWARSKNYAVMTVDELPDDISGERDTTLLIEGPYAYGYAQHESGIHCLLGHLPSGGECGQHTSLASVRVYPCLDDDTPVGVVDFEPANLQITVMHAQEIDGQHVGNVEGAVRAVHLPTGMAASCQHAGSQRQNRICALSLLKAKLYGMELEKKAQSAADTRHALPVNEWSSPIRSYALQPPKVVRDARTGYEATSDAVQSVLDGDLGGFMEASLRKFKKKA